MKGMILASVILVASGCNSPEDGRPRGGGNGGDGGNYARGAIHVPSKIDGTKSWTEPSPSPSPKSDPKT